MASGWIAPKTRKAIYARDNMTCCYCGKVCQPYSTDTCKIAPLDIVTLDHIVSQDDLFKASESLEEFKARRQDPKNIVVACNGCNSSKKNTSLFVWCATNNKDYTVILTNITNRINNTI